MSQIESLRERPHDAYDFDYNIKFSTIMDSNAFIPFMGESFAIG